MTYVSVNLGRIHQVKEKPTDTITSVLTSSEIDLEVTFSPNRITHTERSQKKSESKPISPIYYSFFDSRQHTKQRFLSRQQPSNGF